MSLEVVNKVDVAEGKKVSRKLLLSWPLPLTTTTTSTKKGVPWEYDKGACSGISSEIGLLALDQSMDASDGDTKGASNSELPLSFIPFLFLPIMRLQTNAC